MKPGVFLLLIIVFVVAVLGAGHFIAPEGSGKTGVPAVLDIVGHRSDAFERVMDSGTLRCGYYVYPPVTYRDPNTGKLSGFAVDMMDFIAEQTGLKVEWAEEVSFGNWPAALQAKRFDAMCTPSWASMAVGRAALIGKPFIYSSVIAIGRAGDTRFKSLADLNRPTVKISIHEGNDVYSLVKAQLPDATIMGLPANADPTQPIMDITAGKADVMISDMNAVQQWNKANPSKKIAPSAGGERLKLQGFSLAVATGEHDLLAFLNNAVDDMTATGTIRRMMAKWMEFGDIYVYPDIAVKK